MEASGKFNVSIKKLSGDKCSLQVDPSWTVLELKQQVAELVTMDVNQIKIILRGAGLVDEKTVADYKIKENDEINCVVNLRGGNQ